MSDRTCPLGEDCDLTVAWMAGAEDQRKHMHGRLSEAAARIEALEAALLAADELARAVDDLMAQSTGVAGLHMNGDLAPWEELVEGGRFEEWLLPLTAYRQASDATR